jgi:hypothetical protein
MINCTLSGNQARFGGGLDCLPDSSPVLTNCYIFGNTATARGGGMRCYESDPILNNCIIAHNSASESGGGLYCEYQSNAVLNNCTITGNTAGTGGGLACNQESAPSLTNCILWGDTPSEIFLDGGAPMVTFCDVQGGWSGTGNIHADPLFRDADGPDGDPHSWHDNDYRLASGSPCIDAGDPGFAPEAGATDADERTRIWDGDGNGQPRVDMGAYEFGSFRFGDVNCDGSINVFDIDAFVLALVDPAAYAEEYSGCDASCDLDHDGHSLFVLTLRGRTDGG